MGRFDKILDRIGLQKKMVDQLGQIYLDPLEDDYTDTEITADVLFKAAHSGHAERILAQLVDLIVEGWEFDLSSPDDLEADESDELRTELLDKIRDIDRNHFHTNTTLHQIFQDRTATYGSAIFEYGLGDDGTQIVPAFFDRLPARSFSDDPGHGAREITGRYLRGIVYNLDTHKFTYHQTQTGVGGWIEIPADQIIHIRDESSEFIDGTPMVARCIKTLYAWEFARKAFIQGVNRFGVPPAIIYTPVEALHPGKGNTQFGTAEKVWNYSKNVMKRLSKDTVMMLPFSRSATGENIGPRIEFPSVDTPINPIEVDKYFINELITLLIPRDFMDNQGQAISQSSQPIFDTLELFIQGQRNMLEDAVIRQIWYPLYMEPNGYQDWDLQIQWRQKPEDMDAKLKTLELAGKYMFAFVNELRAAADLDELDDKEMGDLLEERSKVVSVSMGMGGGKVQAQEADNIDTDTDTDQRMGILALRSVLKEKADIMDYLRMRQNNQ